MEIRPIAHLRSDFPEKFGIPRQSGLVPSLESRIVFCPEFRDPNALRGLEGFSHIWLIWAFSANLREGKWQPLVRPPRLGGNQSLGVFATRSSFRPNGLALSSVPVLGIDLDTSEGPVIRVGGADLLDGTPIFDIKPYVRYTDSHPEAVSGFVDKTEKPTLKVDFPESWLNRVPADKREALLGVLAQDPRPAYQDNPERIYGLSFAGQDIRFRVEGDRLMVTEVKFLG